MTRAKDETLKLALVMIVRDEASIIERCLDSVRGLVDFVLVEDTGSADGTPAVIEAWLERQGMEGRVYSEPWRDFARNRSQVMANLRDSNPEIDYALMMDADDEIVLDQGFDPTAFKNGLTLDAYYVPIRLSLNHFVRVQIFSNRKEFSYQGVVHEVLHRPPDAGDIGMAEGLHIEARSEGARSRDPAKHAKDAELLERALGEEKDPHLRRRYVFYLAQSYRDGGVLEKGLANYVRRSQMGGWEQEVYVSLCNAARLQEVLGRPYETAIATLRQAAKVLDDRVEAIYDASRIYRLAGRFRESYETAKTGLGISQPTNTLFVRSWIYDYGLLDELASAAYGAGEHGACLEACEQVLAKDRIPDDVRDRVRKNASIAKQHLATFPVS